ncbi:MAG: dihydroorotate dehydrogenase electron transfer subunit [Muribaculaceae bacterium]|nr:dihydroorotate dehydrogenase electron transfer subunit [Muribaculaceae bacterium]
MKQAKDFKLVGNRKLPSGCHLMTFVAADGGKLPPTEPGQFVQVRIDNSPKAFLRRPISICDVRYETELVLFVKPQGEGTQRLVELCDGAVVNIMLPLGHGFTYNDSRNKKVILAGGGVGAAPLVALCRQLVQAGADVTVAVGGRTVSDVQGVDDLYANGASRVLVATDDGSYGHKGVVTSMPEFEEEYDRIYCCGPTPMMKAVARIARAKNIWCEVSLENHMACGIGACLCCVENTSDRGNVCVCTEGPVFNINRLQSWE